MTVRIRKKNVRMRGTKTHGWGSKKKHRGSGNRGGFGMAGSGKRADQRKLTIFKDYGTGYFGKRGFRVHFKRKIKAVNLSYLEEHFDRFISKKMISEEKGRFVVELKKLGYDKLLGDGHVSRKMLVKAEFATPRAIERVKEAGGDVIVSGNEKEEQATKEA